MSQVAWVWMHCSSEILGMDAGSMGRLAHAKSVI
jgi:hypothetical protein